MGRRMGRLRRLIAVGVPLAFVMAALLPGVARADDRQGVVVGPHQEFAGKTYAEWSVAWWRWAASMPSTASPLLDDSGAKCGLNQHGPVWFLAGTATNTTTQQGDVIGKATRDCTVPANKAILIPVLNAECSPLPSDCGPPSDYASLLQRAKLGFGGATTSATLDHEDVSPVQATSPRPPFSITWVDGNPFGVEAATTVSVAYGFWVLIRPLSEGSHTISVHGFAPSITGMSPAKSFTIDVTYHLTIKDRNEGE